MPERNFSADRSIYGKRLILTETQAFRGEFMNGILNVYKEKGFTSHDVVAKLRGMLHQKKIGHTGTLDPDAQGVLPVCLGTAAKVCGLLTDKDKEYEAVLLLGSETDTQDSGGTVLKQTKVCAAESEIREAVLSFQGTYDQIPPMYSALKVNGKKLCDLARAGVEIERRPRQVQIYEIEIQKISLPRVWMRVHCSKGTYIRTLCHDIGRRLGCGGCMEELLRTKVSIFDIAQSVKLSQIQRLSDENRLFEILLPPDGLFMEYPKAAVTPEFEKMLRNGNRLPKQALKAEAYDGRDAADTASVSGTCGGLLRVYLNNDFWGLYAPDDKKGDFKPVKIFGQGNEGQ